MGPNTPQSPQQSDPANLPVGSGVPTPGMAPGGFAPAGGDMLPGVLPAMPTPMAMPTPVQPGQAAPMADPFQQGPAQPQGQGQVTPAFQPAPPAQPLAAGGVPGQAVLQARQLVAQYGHDPARLSAELERLKSAYLAAQFGIITNTAKI
jgi:hypothetical protein